MGSRNPFRPSFGITPTVVVSRELVTMNVGPAFLEGPGSPYRLTLVSGPRCPGKTVLLNLLEEEARHRGWTVSRETSSHDMVEDLVATDIPALSCTTSSPHWTPGTVDCSSPSTYRCERPQTTGTPLHRRRTGHGYSYLIQLLGSLSWTLGSGERITPDDVAAAFPLTRERMGLQAHVPVLREVPEHALEFLRPVAVLRAPAPHRKRRRTHGYRRESGARLPPGSRRRLILPGASRTSPTAPGRSRSERVRRRR